ncbi:hypothetical protein DFP73DRAFT_297515 [Morchella snyderi]|nr:hypothetical protein DFP73DRAFT_297515 [Morchella snyderi]
MCERVSPNGEKLNTRSKRRILGLGRYVTSVLVFHFSFLLLSFKSKLEAIIIFLTLLLYTICACTTATHIYTCLVY